MNDERDRAREGLPPPTAPYLPVRTGGTHPCEGSLRSKSHMVPRKVTTDRRANT